jgi:NAD(P)-dependent dehydrogenase (short-subunit alcohol dehydrogenase family)
MSTNNEYNIATFNTQTATYNSDTAQHTVGTINATTVNYSNLNAPVINFTAPLSNSQLVPPTTAALAQPYIPLSAAITSLPNYSDGTTRGAQVSQMIVQSYAYNYGREPSPTEFNTAYAGLIAVTGDNNMTGTNNQYWGADAFDNTLINTTEFNSVNGLIGTIPGAFSGLPGAVGAGSLAGKQYIVAGMSSGYGFMAAVQLAQAGANVYGFARSSNVFLAHKNSALETQWSNTMPWEQYNGPIKVPAAVFSNIYFSECDIRSMSNLTTFYEQFNHLNDNGTPVSGLKGTIDGIVVTAGCHGNTPLLSFGAPSWMADSYVDIAEDIAATPHRFKYPGQTFIPDVAGGAAAGWANGIPDGAAGARYNNQINTKNWGIQFNTKFAIRTLAANPNPTSYVLTSSVAKYQPFSDMYIQSNKTMSTFMTSIQNYVKTLGYNIRVNIYYPVNSPTGLNIAQNAHNPSIAAGVENALTGGSNVYLRYEPGFPNRSYPTVQGAIATTVPSLASVAPLICNTFTDYFTSFVKCANDGSSTDWYIDIGNSTLLSFLIVGSNTGPYSIPTYGITAPYEVNPLTGEINALGFRNQLFTSRVVTPITNYAGVTSPMYNAAHFVDALINPSKTGGHYVGKQIKGIAPNGPFNLYNAALPISALRVLLANDVANADLKSYTGTDPYLRSIAGDSVGLTVF